MMSSAEGGGFFGGHVRSDVMSLCVHLQKIKTSEECHENVWKGMKNDAECV